MVVGGGKVAQRQAEALEEILGDRIAGGQINAKKGDSVRLKRIPVTLAGHPIPDEDSVAGAQRIVEIERSCEAGRYRFSVPFRRRHRVDRIACARHQPGRPADGLPPALLRMRRGDAGCERGAQPTGRAS